MKVIHIESGLGNQMLSYCEYLAMKKENPDDQIYIETIIYEIPEANDAICQWNGYELERIFNIKVPNIKELFTEEQWKSIISDVRESKFWERNWNYPVIFTDILRKYGLELKNIRGDFESNGWSEMVEPRELSLKRCIKKRLERFLPYIYIRQYVQKRREGTILTDYSKNLFVKTTEDIFTGQRLEFKFKNSGIERIESEIRQSFQFPEIKDCRNAEALEYIKSHNSVAIHARRGDMLGLNYSCYVAGYFKRANIYIRSIVNNPIFFVFCDSDSIEWAKENQKKLGLDFNCDEIHFVDWNKSGESFRDMQLMTACKYHVITHSTFGWWAAWLNTYSQKITCSPNPLFNTTHCF